MLFEAEYAKNYASILYQCLGARMPGQRRAGKLVYYIGSASALPIISISISRSDVNRSLQGSQGKHSPVLRLPQLQLCRTDIDPDRVDSSSSYA